VRFDWTDPSNYPNIATTWRAGLSCCSDAWMSDKLRCEFERPVGAGFRLELESALTLELVDQNG
jgi:hypothetical protein